MNNLQKKTQWDPGTEAFLSTIHQKPHANQQQITHIAYMWY
jgi:hypothetical protein